MGLSLVPTPIGNLGDFTHRAATVLDNADLILAEDTRTSGRLLQHYKIDTPLQSFHMHNEHQRVAWVIDLLKQGQQIALISDAGTPGISDPGFLLVRAAIAEGIEVECLPGATALIPALVQSGLPSDRFHFEGFLPPKKGRQSRLEYLAQNPHTTILYESPHKLLKTLEQLKEHFEHDRVVSISRELTKLYETTFRGTLSEAQQFFETNPPKGEFVLCIAGKSKK
ncbi:MAG: 16S rRNA (cytidine(1402)-2'-O)-methyltransferase [Flavobacteriaceae bacterium]